MISVKANQKTLYQQLQDLAQTDEGLSVHLDVQRTRNRQTTRVVSVFPLTERLRTLWKGAQQGIEIIRCGTRAGEPYSERRYDITSWTQKADALQARIRAHWGIENPLHWVKDVGLGEDQSSIAARPAATLMAIIRNLAITLFRRTGYPSITDAIDRFSNDLNQLLPMSDFPTG